MFMNRNRTKLNINLSVLRYISSSWQDSWSYFFQVACFILETALSWVLGWLLLIIDTDFSTKKFKKLLAASGFLVENHNNWF